MDWGRAKTILIVLFSLLNVFLFGTIIYTNTTIRFNSDYTRYALAYMERRNISLNTSVPARGAKAPSLSYQAEELNIDPIASLISDTANQVFSEVNGLRQWQDEKEYVLYADDYLKLSDQNPEGIVFTENRSEMASSLKKYLSRLNLNETGYVMDSLLLEDGQWKGIFSQRYKKEILFDNRLFITLDRENTLTLEGGVKKVKKALSPDAILTAYEILVLGNLPNDSVITVMDFGYMRVKEGDLFDTPVWRILLNDQEERFYNAYTGERVIEE